MITSSFGPNRSLWISRIRVQAPRLQTVFNPAARLSPVRAVHEAHNVSFHDTEREKWSWAVHIEYVIVYKCWAIAFAAQCMFMHACAHCVRSCTINIICQTQYLKLYPNVVGLMSSTQKRISFHAYYTVAPNTCGRWRDEFLQTAIKNIVGFMAFGQNHVREDKWNDRCYCVLNPLETAAKQ